MYQNKIRIAGEMIRYPFELIGIILNFILENIITIIIICLTLWFVYWFFLKRNYERFKFLVRDKNEK